MPLCNICSNLDFFAASQTDVNEFLLPRTNRNNLFFYSSWDEIPRRPGDVLIPYHESLESLHAGAALCELCRLVKEGVDAFLSKIGDTRALSSSGFWIGGRANADGFQVLVSDERNGTRGHIYDLVAGFGFCVENESRLNTIIRGRMVSPSPFDPLVLDNIKDWRRRCSEEHKHVKPQPRSLPNRVLDITNHAQKAVLCNFHDTTGEYAALSYCWGSVSQMSLTSRTMKSLREGVGVRDLPQTFQDAIWVTHQLGIRYLWVDGLCIIQDDMDDREQEIARMSDIYGNSAITIAACRATNSGEGFLGERLENTYVPIPFNADGISERALAFPVPLKEAGDAVRFFEIEDEPLSNRGWALQERYLSPRTLHFCHSKIFFECARGWAVEDFCYPIHPSSAPEFGPGGFSAKGPKEQCYQDWRRIVTQYSQRKLTIEDDKLPALAGLAARISPSCTPEDGISGPHNRYMAGLWLDDMIRGMCWSTGSFSSPGIRSREYRAPTWSWASVDGEIDYMTNWANSISELAFLQDAHVDLEFSENPFGKVVGGWVYLKALRLRPYMKPDNISFWICEGGAVFRMVVHWDSEPHRAPKQGKQEDPAAGDTELFAVPLGWVEHHLQAGPEDDKLLGPMFLIIKSAGHRVDLYARVPGFQRVGFGTAVWLSDGEKGIDREGLKRLITERFATAKERGNLEDIILF